MLSWETTLLARESEGHGNSPISATGNTGAWWKPGGEACSSRPLPGGLAPLGGLREKARPAVDGSSSPPNPAPSGEALCWGV